jgi:TetR/AcrR family transcriptional regulator, lmrAB and yxaGH operons repressor
MQSANRDSLLAPIAQVFRERGYEGATLTQLSAATGLGKASLYHHFPGGKSEMAEVLLRRAIADLERQAFAHLTGPKKATERLQRFVDGFAAYLDDTGDLCVLGVLGLGSARQRYGVQISEQFRDWNAHLERALLEGGAKPKKAARTAAEALNLLYGAQLVARLLDDPDHLPATLKRVNRRLLSSLS